LQSEEVVQKSLQKKSLSVKFELSKPKPAEGD